MSLALQVDQQRLVHNLDASQLRRRERDFGLEKVRVRPIFIQGN